MRSKLILALTALALPILTFAFVACSGTEEAAPVAEEGELRTGRELGASCDSMNSCQVGLACKSVDAGAGPVRVGLPMPVDAGSGPVRVGLPQPARVGVCVREVAAQLDELCESGFAAPGSPATRSCDRGLVCFKTPQDPNGPSDADFGVCKRATKAQLGEICDAGFAAPGSPGTRSCDTGLVCFRAPSDPNGPTDADFGTCVPGGPPVRVDLPQPSR